MSSIILNKFPTHIEITNNKTKPNKWMKINSQSIYNGMLARFARAIAVKNMHGWIKDQLKDVVFPELEFPVQLQLDIYTVINHGDISRRKGEIKWKPPAENYKPNFDEDNLSYIWIKCIKDVLSQLEFWPDDNIQYCLGTNSMIHFVDDIEDRKIEISFKSI